ncbi:MAG TPA: type II toxin-antitoxin system VapC family toxin [Solirubrobacterales bacterium]|nr:type II toxin-antitoxin system VapC family toxin [Solirubrobacterales bacterium]
MRLRGASLSIYLDTSALVKLLVDEDGSDLARSTYADADGPRTTAIAYVEATSAVTRMRKGKRLSAAELRTALDELDTIWAALDVLEVTDTLVKTAARTARDHTLRAYDAVHLAGALAFAEGEEIAFMCWDHELNEAADKHGFVLIPERS